MVSVEVSVSRWLLTRVSGVKGGQRLQQKTQKPAVKIRGGMRRSVCSAGNANWGNTLGHALRRGLVEQGQDREAMRIGTSAGGALPEAAIIDFPTEETVDGRCR